METKVLELNIPVLYFPLLLDYYFILLFKLKPTSAISAGITNKVDFCNARESGLALLESVESLFSSVIFSLPD